LGRAWARARFGLVAALRKEGNHGEGKHGGKIAVGTGSVESDLPRHRTGVERVRCGARLGGMMTLSEGIAFWIFIIMTVSFFAWVAYLAFTK
jgi:hypothetical protein